MTMQHASRIPAQEPGIAFPADAQGRRSTSETSKVILAKAAAAVSDSSAKTISNASNWRKDYARHFHHLVELGLQSPEAAVATARAGLNAAHQQFVFNTPDGDKPLDEAMQRTDDQFRTLELNGRSPHGPAPWAVPVNGELLSGERLRVQIERWLRRGALEPSAAEALHRCLDNPDWFDLSDRTFALLGAASEAGPLSWLAHWRARVVAVDIQAQKPWQRILKEMGEGNGVLYAPVAKDSSRNSLEEGWDEDLGADLLTQTPAIAQWLQSIDRPLDLGCLAYLHSEKHTRLSIAMDAIACQLMSSKPETTLAYMATPTDSFAVPEAVAHRVMNAWQRRSAMRKLAQWPLSSFAFKPAMTQVYESSNGKRYGIVDSTITQQGPNYALAKRLQQWRSIVARSEGRHAVMNIAPSSTTRSVVSNPALAAGFAGAGLFDVEVFAPETTNSLMAALWVHELRHPGSLANPANTPEHPYELFMENAIHGGLWSVPYLARSVLPFAAAAGFVKQRLPDSRR